MTTELSERNDSTAPYRNKRWLAFLREMASVKFNSHAISNVEFEKFMAAMVKAAERIRRLQ